MKLNDFQAYKVDGSKGNSFIGIRIYGNCVNFYYPESYQFNPNDCSNKEIIDLLNTISLAKSNSMELNEMNDQTDIGCESAFESSMWLIVDYIKNGAYKTKEKVYSAGKGQKVNWKKCCGQAFL